MKFFTAAEIFNSFFFSILLGIISGCIYKSSVCILCALKKTVLIPWDALKVSSAFSTREVKRISQSRDNIKLTILGKNIFEGILFSLFGLSIILIIYIFLDGVFRFYIILTVVIFFVISVKTIAKGFGKAFTKTYDKFYIIELFIMALFLLPTTKVSVLIFNVILKLISPIKIKLKIKKSLQIQKRKIKETIKLY